MVSNALNKALFILACSVGSSSVLFVSGSTDQTGEAAQQRFRRGNRREGHRSQQQDVWPYAMMQNQACWAMPYPAYWAMPYQAYLGMPYAALQMSHESQTIAIPGVLSPITPNPAVADESPYLAYVDQHGPWILDSRTGRLFPSSNTEEGEAGFTQIPRGVFATQKPQAGILSQFNAHAFVYNNKGARLNIQLVLESMLDRSQAFFQTDIELKREIAQWRRGNVALDFSMTQSLIQFTQVLRTHLVQFGFNQSSTCTLTLEYSDVHKSFILHVNELGIDNISRTFISLTIDHYWPDCTFTEALTAETNEPTTNPPPQYDQAVESTDLEASTVGDVDSDVSSMTTIASSQLQESVDTEHVSQVADNKTDASDSQISNSEILSTPLSFSQIASAQLLNAIKKPESPLPTAVPTKQSAAKEASVAADEKSDSSLPSAVPSKESTSKVTSKAADKKPDASAKKTKTESKIQENPAASSAPQTTTTQTQSKKEAAAGGSTYQSYSQAASSSETAAIKPKAASVNQKYTEEKSKVEKAGGRQKKVQAAAQESPAKKHEGNSDNTAASLPEQKSEVISTVPVIEPEHPVNQASSSDAEIEAAVLAVEAFEAQQKPAEVIASAEDLCEGEQVYYDGSFALGHFELRSGSIVLPVKKGPWASKTFSLLTVEVKSVQDGALKASVVLTLNSQGVPLSFEDVSVLKSEKHGIFLNACEISTKIGGNEIISKEFAGGQDAPRLLLFKLDIQSNLNVALTAWRKSDSFSKEMFSGFIPRRPVVESPIPTVEVAPVAVSNPPAEKKKDDSGPAGAKASTSNTPAKKKKPTASSPTNSSDTTKAAGKTSKASKPNKVDRDDFLNLDEILDQFSSGKASRFPSGDYQASGKLQMTTGGAKKGKTEIPTTIAVRVIFPESPADLSVPSSVDATLVVDVRREHVRIYRQSAPLPVKLQTNKIVELDKSLTVEFFKSVFSDLVAQGVKGPAFESIATQGVSTTFVFSDEDRNVLTLSINMIKGNTPIFNSDLAFTTELMEPVRVPESSTVKILSDSIEGGIFEFLKYAPAERLAEVEKYDEIDMRVELAFSQTDKTVDLKVSMVVKPEQPDGAREVVMWFADKGFDYHMESSRNIRQIVIDDQTKLKNMFMQDPILRQLIRHRRSISLKITHMPGLLNAADSYENSETITVELVSQDDDGVYAPTPVFAALMVRQKEMKSPSSIPEGRFEGAGVVAEEMRTFMHRVPKMNVEISPKINEEDVNKISLTLQISSIAQSEQNIHQFQINEAEFRIDPVDPTYSSIVVLDVEQIASQITVFQAIDSSVASLDLSLRFDQLENALVCVLRVLKADETDALYVQTSFATKISSL